MYHKMKCYDLSFSFSKRARNLYKFLDIVCPKCDGCLHHDKRGANNEKIDASILYETYWPEARYNTVLEYSVWCANRSTRVIFIKFVLDLHHGGKGHMVHFDGNWVPLLPHINGGGFSWDKIFSSINKCKGNFTVAKNWEDTQGNDFVTVSSYIKLMKGPEVALHDTHDIFERYQNSLNLVFKWGISNMVFCDFAVISKGQRFWCHKFMLSSRSPVFRAMLSPRFAEFHEDCLVLNNYSANSVIILLKHIYGQPLPRVIIQEEKFEVLELLNKYRVEICLEDFYKPSMCQNLGEKCSADIVKFLISDYDGNPRTAINLYQRVQNMDGQTFDLTALHIWSLEKVLNYQLPNEKGGPFAGFWLDALIAGSKASRSLEYEERHWG